MLNTLIILHYYIIPFSVLQHISHLHNIFLLISSYLILISIIIHIHDTNTNCYAIEYNKGIT